MDLRRPAAVTPLSPRVPVVAIGQAVLPREAQAVVDATTLSPAIAVFSLLREMADTQRRQKGGAEPPWRKCRPRTLD